MSNAAITEHSINVRRDIDVMMDRLKQLSNSFHLIEESDYSVGVASLSQAYGENEPDYNDSDLVWKNPNYVPPG